MTHAWAWDAAIRWHFCQHCGFMKTPFNGNDRCRGSRS